MSTATEILLDGYDRVRDEVHAVVDGLDEDQLAVRLDPDANSIAWLVWHLTRVQDDHVAGVAGTGQRWTSGGWEERFGLPFDTSTVGYGQSSADVGAVVGLSAELLTAYYDDVHAASVGFLAGLSDDDLARVVDENWDPPVTMAVRLLSVVSDDLQHAGQAAFIRGVLLRRG
jgi:hypothetical protein